MADREPTPAIVAQAAEWLAHLESGDATAADIATFEAWRAAQPAHALAIERLGGLSGAIDHAEPLERETLRRLFLPRKRRAGAALLGVVAAAGAGWLALQTPAAKVQFADERTQPGEMRDVALSQGDRLVMGTDSAADVDDPGKRTVRLLRGEIMATVATGSGTPFVIATDDGTLEALGTVFTARKEADGTLLAVIESHVRACPAAAAATACKTLAPGERARMTRDAVVRIDTRAPADIAAWTEGWLPVEDRPLLEVLDELNRWRATPIRFDREALGGLRVSGIFPLRDTDRATANLARLLPIEIDAREPTSPVITRR